ncbi:MULTISPECIES: ABC transporter ATP-binding protein [unclassified Variovorax]|uniref:ABC transporter ATP-binding protein n=1 Tax=unclassified Variovorax TaxID=663243 RepID=UPI00076BEAF9|nr:MULTISPECIES: ABC transporter ATP-binding protein [unclassified Variovorax]KWT96820.1 putative ATP-binding transport protein [Variovorax sp. WDL1]PNG47197.1 Lipoprotein-releasing system ATP-binding protein LolD [Variovorax sp. B2]PNG48152.1 Lipoprotein-releasing system ATP-binding protein LolD [Variovorax sp. B4]VTV15077.1 Lipoprotein-releasing system ATP-binding protein LolD [Variovorax sp. WDL1]
MRRTAAPKANSTAAEGEGTPVGNAEPGAGPVIRVEHVTRTLEGEVPVTLVKDVSLEIDRGEFVCVMGPSGSGKSSLLYLLGLIDVPTQGRIWIDGQDTSAFDEDRLADFRLARLGYVFQFHFLLPEFSALDNVSLPIRRLGRLSDREAEARAAELLDQFGLEGHHRKRPSQLSGGQRQRVAIARALANDPLVILADEPTGNLDSASSTNVRDILRSLTRELHKSVVAVTHDTDFASAADRRIGIVDGRIDMAWRPERGA